MDRRRSLQGIRPVKVLFVRPPRHYWPILNESDNFLLPLGFPCLAAYVRREMPDVEVDILDCCVEGIGWANLATELERRSPHVVCVGEKVVYAHEGFRLVSLARKILPEVITIAGGHFVSHLPDHSLTTCPELDYVIRYEGEVPLVSLLRNLQNGGDLGQTPNLCWRDGEGFHESDLGANVHHLDDLPIPAYDLVPLQKYAPFGLLWPKAVTVQRSRGCVDTCRFCSWIAVESKHTRDSDGVIHTSPQFRSKSVDRMISEIELLYEKYGVRYLFWVDATWNTDNKWLDEFCSEIIRRKYELGWWAFTRIDLLLHQEKQGILEKMVKAGLRHVLVGVERSADLDLGWLNKHGYKESVAYQAFHLLRDKYPQVFRQGTFITGVRSDTAESIRSLLDFAHGIDCDFAAFHPITPFPGTPLYEEALSRGWLEESDFSKYDMFGPVMSTEHLTREEVAHWTTWCQKNFVARMPLRYFSRLLSPHQNRRKLHWWFAYSISRVMARQVINHVKGVESFEGFAGVNKLWRPDWYER